MMMRWCIDQYIICKTYVHHQFVKTIQYEHCMYGTPSGPIHAAKCITDVSQLSCTQTAVCSPPGKPSRPVALHPPCRVVLPQRKQGV